MQYNSNPPPMHSRRGSGVLSHFHSYVLYCLEGDACPAMTYRAMPCRTHFDPRFSSRFVSADVVFGD